MNRIIHIMILGIAFSLSCERTWDDHYSADDTYVDHSIWEEIVTNPDYSQFKSYVEGFDLEGWFQNSDTLISTKTVFIPSNSAFLTFTQGGGEVTASQILYHLIKSLFLLSNIYQLPELLYLLLLYTSRRQLLNLR